MSLFYDLIHKVKNDTFYHFAHFDEKSYSQRYFEMIRGLFFRMNLADNYFMEFRHNPLRYLGVNQD
jgi:hypothetical protein